MIPKIIHYCWLSNDPFPKTIQNCIDSWKKLLPDYELMLWNYDRFPRGKSKWVDQAFNSHKYAFAADYIRLYALYNYGGIYLDSDVEVLKSFNEFLHLPYFLGKENTTSGVEAATMGFQKGHPLIGTLLEKYEGKDFINQDGTYNDEALPYIIRRCIESRYNYVEIRTPNDFTNNDDCIFVLPVDWFSPKHWQTREINCTNNTYSIHHFSASWKKEISEKENTNTPQTRKICEIASIINNFIKKIIHYINLRLCHIAVKNSTFASLYIPLYFSDRFYITKNMWINRCDYKVLHIIKMPLNRYELIFIKPEDSRIKLHNDIDLPVAKLLNYNIEIHHAPPGKYEIVTRKDFLNEFKSA